MGTAGNSHVEFSRYVQKLDNMEESGSMTTFYVKKFLKTQQSNLAYSLRL
jgi:hypothetical protein